MSERRMTICPLLTSSAHGSFAKKRSASATAEVPSLESACKEQRGRDMVNDNDMIEDRTYRNEHVYVII